MILAATVCGAVIATRSSPAKTDLTVWTFTDLHARIFRGDGSKNATRTPLVDLYRQETGQTVGIKLIGNQAITVRLNSIFDNGGDANDVPDLVEIEIGSVGRFFRPPLNEIGFLPLNDRLAASGWDKRILPSRLAPWSKQGVIFGVPHDVHPVSITYRRDLFEKAGVKLDEAKTWPAFQEKCLAFQTYWAAHGFPRRRAMELAVNSSDGLQVMLLQRHINLLDSDNTSHMTDPRVAATVAFYAHCVVGDRAIGADSSPGSNVWLRDLTHGDLACFITPDWRTGVIKTSGRELKGKLAMMPLPRFDPTDAPTATWGGTMIAIPKQARDPEKSWRLLQFLYLSPAAMQARSQYTGTLPPVIEAWDDSSWHEPDELFNGQKIGELYIDLARQLPDRYVTPFTTLAGQALAQVLSRAEIAIKNGEEAGLDQRIAGWLIDADAEVRKRIAFGRFDE